MGFWRQLFRNATALWGSLIVRTLIAFLFTPFITSQLGSSSYGLWVIIFQTINYFTLLDFGMHRALLRFLGQSLARGEIDDTNRILNTATLLYGIAGVLVLIATPLVGNVVFAQLGDVTPQATDEAQFAFLIVGIYLAVRFWLMPFAGSLGGFQRYDIGNGLEISEEVVRTLLMVVALLSGYGLVALAGIIFGMSLVRQVIAIVCLRKIEPRVRFDPGAANKETSRQLLRYATVSFGITVAWLVIFNTDSILLGFLMGPAWAGVFAPAAQMMLYLRQGVDAVGTPLMPAISQLEGQKRDDLIRHAYLRISAYMTFLSFFLCAGVVLYAHPFVRLWLPPEFAQSGSVMVLLAAGSAFYLPHIIGNSLLFGIGKHRYLLAVLAVEGALKLILSFVLIPRYGISGMALAAAVPQIVVYIVVFPWVMAKALSLPMGRIVLNLLRSAVPALVATVAVSLAMRYLIGVASWGALIANVGIVTLVVAVSAWYLLLGPLERQRLTDALRAFRARA